MDEQTKVGTGAAAGIALMALIEPHVFESHSLVAVLVYVVLVSVMIWGLAPAAVRTMRRVWGLNGGIKWMWPQYLMLVCGIGFFVGLVGFLQLNVTPPAERAVPPPATSDRQPPTILQFFQQNQAKFPTASKQSTDVTMVFPDGQKLVIKSDLYRDALARTMFMAFYIPHSPLTYDAIIALSDEYTKIMQDMMSNIIISGKFPGSSAVTQDELAFTGRIFIFHEDELSLQERAQADSIYKSKKLGIQFRGIEELMNQWNAEQSAKPH